MEHLMVPEMVAAIELKLSLFIVSVFVVIVLTVVVIVVNVRHIFSSFEMASFSVKTWHKTRSSFFSDFILHFKFERERRLYFWSSCLPNAGPALRTLPQEYALILEGRRDKFAVCRPEPRVGDACLVAQSLRRPRWQHNPHNISSTQDNPSAPGCVRLPCWFQFRCRTNPCRTFHNISLTIYLYICCCCFFLI